jgi:hypothetical protein
MEQSISRHIVRLLPGEKGAILSLDNAREMAVNLDCMPKEMLERLHIGDPVWCFPQPGDEPPTKSARVIAISPRYGTNYLTGVGQSANG